MQACYTCALEYNYSGSHRALIVFPIRQLLSCNKLTYRQAVLYRRQLKLCLSIGKNEMCSRDIDQASHVQLILHLVCQLSSIGLSVVLAQEQKNIWLVYISSTVETKVIHANWCLLWLVNNGFISQKYGKYYNTSIL